MALRNGVLVHGPTSWGCAVRLPDGTLKVASERKRFLAAVIGNPILRGPARLLEAMAVLPAVKRRLPEAKLPFEQPNVVAVMLASAVAARSVRDSRLRPAARELATGLLSVAPALFSLRGGELTAYHGAEHISIGTYEHDEPRAREHERCGSHLVGPLVVTTAVAHAVAQKLPPQFRTAARAIGTLGAVAASTELFGWMVRNHELTDDEISEEPDFERTYPPHCLRGTRGARKIEATEQEDPVPIGLAPLPERFLRGREFLLLKKNFDVFTNPNAERLLELLDPDEVILFGVATDVCDDAAIRGLLARGRRVRFVEDAARGLDEARVARRTAEWREQGVEFASAAEAAGSLQGIAQ